MGIKGTLIATATVIVVYFGSMYIGNEILHSNVGEPSAIFLSLMPFIIYLILSDRIAHFKGGGIEVQFRDALQESITFTPQPASYANCSIIESGSLSALSRAIFQIAENPATALSLRICEKYDQTLLTEYLRQLANFDFFKYIVFVDCDSKFLGFINARILLSRLEKDRTSKQVSSLIENGMIKSISGYRTDFVESNTSSKDCLIKLKEKNIDIAVVDENNSFIGFTNKQTVVSGILTAFILKSNKSQK